MNNELRLINAVRDGNLNLHCVSISITQKCSGGLDLKGHGVFKINGAGTIYLEFVCTEENFKEANTVKGFGLSFPILPYDEGQILYLSATALDNTEYFAQGFSFKVRVFDWQAPLMFNIFFNDIFYLGSEGEQSFGNYLYFEMLEKPTIPANKMNSEWDTYGQQSSAWNESEFHVHDVKVTITERNDRVVVQVDGEFNGNEYFDALLLYICLSSGVMPQPYYVYKRVGNERRKYVKSVRSNLRGKCMPTLLSHAISADGFPKCHYELLSSILKVKRESSLYFSCIQSQWERVWHAFQSDKNITVLTLSVAVEGLLNDIFIPAIKKKNINESFEILKDDLVQQLEKLNAEDEHKESLISAVRRWGNIHPTAALNFLIKAGVITTQEKKAWDKLRNSSAHPVFRNNDELRDSKEIERLLSTLTLMYRLIFNVFEYDGPILNFRAGKGNELLAHKYINVLNLFSDGSSS